MQFTNLSLLRNKEQSFYNFQSLTRFNKVDNIETFLYLGQTFLKKSALPAFLFLSFSATREYSFKNVFKGIGDFKQFEGVAKIFYECMTDFFIKFNFARGRTSLIFSYFERFLYSLNFFACLVVILVKKNKNRKQCPCKAAYVTYHRHDPKWNHTELLLFRRELHVKNTCLIASILPRLDDCCPVCNIKLCNHTWLLWGVRYVVKWKWIF